MVEYVSREDVTQAVVAYIWSQPISASRIAKVINNIPAADVEPVRHGHWIEDGDYQVCSECGEEHAWDEYRASFCEACGAKMDLGGADNG